jgi:uracil-DNA glycosylase
MLTQLATSRLLESAPCIQGVGRKPNKAMIIGEAPGADEARLGIPFVGASGRELDRMMTEAGLNPGEWYRTNVFHTRPRDTATKNNDLATIFVPALEWKTSFPESSPGPAFKIDNKVHYLPPSFNNELDRLTQEITEVSPNLIVCMGATALWALTGRQNISTMRGTTLMSLSQSITPSIKLLPTYHPAAVLRQWDLRPIVIADLMKAKRQAEFPEIRRPRRLITINPTLTDIEAFHDKILSAPLLAVDIETRMGQITEIGFAPSSSEALVVPFIRGFNSHYWPTLGEEVSALRLVKAILQSPVAKGFQNGLYDIQWIWRRWRFAPRNVLHDTMLKHHSLFPEMQKGLGFLGSVYTEEPAWKLMRLMRETEGKSDDE